MEPEPKALDNTGCASRYSVPLDSGGYALSGIPGDVSIQHVRYQLEHTGVRQDEILADARSPRCIREMLQPPHQISA
jgi:hypothetical protein